MATTIPLVESVFVLLTICVPFLLNIEPIISINPFPLFETVVSPSLFITFPEIFTPSFPLLVNEIWPFSAITVPEIFVAP